MIRRANSEDAAGIHVAHMQSIQQLCSKHHTKEEIAGWGNRPFNKEQRLSAIKNHAVWIVEVNSKIEGYAQIAFKEKENVLTGHILGLYLTSIAAGSGLGKKLLQLMIDEAKLRKVNSITLESTITAHGFYEKFGFIDSGVQIAVQIGGVGVRCQPMRLDFLI